MNDKNNKKNISAILLAIVLLVIVVAAYFMHAKIRNHRAEVLADYARLAELENEKGILDIYGKISIEGSKESAQIKKYIITNDRKQVLALIDELETYSKRAGLTENNASPIVSVSTRENAAITKYNAQDLMITMSVAGDEKRLNAFLEVLNSLPLVSYIEKIDMKFDQAGKKNVANIVLIVYQKNETK